MMQFTYESQTYSLQCITSHLDQVVRRISMNVIFLGMDYFQVMDKDTLTTSTYIPSVIFMSDSSYLLRVTEVPAGHYAVRILYDSQFVNSIGIAILSRNERVLVDTEGMIYASIILEIRSV